jgi:hypothetical protein
VNPAHRNKLLSDPRISSEERDALLSTESPQPRTVYDPAWDSEIESFYNRPRRLAPFGEAEPFPPDTPAGRVYRSFQTARVLGGIESNASSECEFFLGVLAETKSDFIRHQAVRSLLTYAIIHRTALSEELFVRARAAIEEQDERYANPKMTNGSPDWLGLCSTDWSNK